MTEIHQAIKQLDATLHPKTTAEIPNTIELTEAMKITPPASLEERRQQLIDAVEASIHGALPQLISTAVDTALAAESINMQPDEHDH
ncbi:MAG: hypothetical protein R8J85_00415 [Mariprofundales bacterium]